MHSRWFSLHDSAGFLRWPINSVVLDSELQAKGIAFPSEHVCAFGSINGCDPVRGPDRSFCLD
jgi:hypothetical protein